MKFRDVKVMAGDVIRFKSDKTRLWVAIPVANIEETDNVEKYNPNVKDHTGLYLFSDYWYPDEGSPMTSKPYGKTADQLRRGRYNDIEEIVGNVQNNPQLLEKL